MSLYKIGTCSYCSEENQILRPSPFMADTKAMMCEHCWNETQKEYSASNGEYISDFDSDKTEYENIKKNRELKRNYVVICNRYKGIAGSLLFWGRKTKDDYERSFGGYTSDFNECEKYTLEEIDNSDYKFPVYGRDINHDNFKKVEDFAIEINRLKRLGHRPMMIYYR